MENNFTTAKKYLASIPEDIMGTMGYEKIVLSQEL